MKIKVNGREVEATKIRIKSEFEEDVPISVKFCFNKKQAEKLGIDDKDAVTVFFMKNGRTVVTYTFTVRSDDNGWKYIEIPSLMSLMLGICEDKKKAVAFATDYGLVVILDAKIEKS